jgi:hypothetical protein
MVATRRNGGAGGRVSRSRTRKAARARSAAASLSPPVRQSDAVERRSCLVYPPPVCHDPSRCVREQLQEYATLRRGMRIFFSAPSWPSLITGVTEPSRRAWNPGEKRKTTERKSRHESKGCCCSVASYVVKIRQAHCSVHVSAPI